MKTFLISFNDQEKATKKWCELFWKSPIYCTTLSALAVYYCFPELLGMEEEANG